VRLKSEIRGLVERLLAENPQKGGPASAGF
jgi:hypothetical protein